MNTDLIIAEHFIRSDIRESVQIIERLEYDEIVDFISEVPLDLASKVLLQMNNYKAAKCLELLDIQVAVELIAKLDLMSIDLLLRHCDEAFRNALLDRTAPNIARKIRQRLQYTSNSVGNVMSLRVFSLQKDASIGEAIGLMKKERELIGSEIFVTDERARFEGIVTITDLILGESKDQISSILKLDIPKVFADDPIVTVRNSPAWSKYRTIPVIDRSEILIGSLHFSDVSRIDMMEDSELKKETIETGNAVGELYWIGLTGLLQSVSKSD
ncbi:MAG: magnesium transporter [Saprospiraceae bacterium]|nr:magnesium transporter [Saprospiraceae bacterium]